MYEIERFYPPLNGTSSLYQRAQHLVVDFRGDSEPPKRSLSMPPRGLYKLGKQIFSLARTFAHFLRSFQHERRSHLQAGQVLLEMISLIALFAAFLAISSHFFGGYNKASYHYMLTQPEDEK